MAAELLDTEDPQARAERMALRARVLEINRAGSQALPLEEALLVLRDERAPAAVRRAVLGRADLPQAVVDEARACADPDVRAHAIAMPATPVDALVAAAVDSTWQVRVAVASHAATPPAVLVELVGDRSSVVRRAAIVHPRVPQWVLVEALVTGTSRLDAEVTVQQSGLIVEDNIARLLACADAGAAALLLRAGLPAELVDRFAMDDHGDEVRCRALRSGARAELADQALRHAESADVRRAAIAGDRATEEALAGAAADAEESVREAVAACMRTPTEAVDQLLVDDYESVRVVAAKSPQASGAALARAVREDANVEVRNTAVRNPSCLVEAVLDGCRDAAVVVFAMSNPACPPEGLFLAMVTLRDEPRVAPEGSAAESAAARRAADVARTIKEAKRRLAPRAWSWLAAQDLEAVHPDDLAALLSRHLPAASLDPRVAVRTAVALHEKVDDQTLLLLASDPDEAVRAAVTRRILQASGGLGL